jgi:hypothetical protein
MALEQCVLFALVCLAAAAPKKGAAASAIQLKGSLHKDFLERRKTFGSDVPEVVHPRLGRDPCMLYAMFSFYIFVLNPFFMQCLLLGSGTLQLVPFLL